MFVPVLKSFSTIDAKIDADADSDNDFFVSADLNGANILTFSADADAVNMLVDAHITAFNPALLWGNEFKSFMQLLTAVELKCRNE